MGRKPIVLVAEDQEDEEFFFTYALWKSGLPIAIKLVKDGQEAVQYLEGLEPYQDRDKYPLPGLLLIDLNKPLMHGFHLLASRSACGAFKSLPTVVLSRSLLDCARVRAKMTGGTDCLLKPTTIGELVNLLRGLHQRMKLAPG